MSTIQAVLHRTVSLKRAELALIQSADDIKAPKPAAFKVEQRQLASKPSADAGPAK